MRRTSVFAIALLCALGQIVACMAADPPKTGEKRDTLIYVRTDPPGAKVLVDGKELGKTNGLFPVEAGVATIILELEGHGQVRKPVTIRAEGITRVEVELKPQTAPAAGQTNSETVAENPEAGGSNPSADADESEPVRGAATGNYWATYERWASYEKGENGVPKNHAKAMKLLPELVKGVYLATFRPIKGFAPKTPAEFIIKFNEFSDLKSEANGIGGASFFRTKNKDGMLIGSFLTVYPDKMRKAIKDNPSLELISIKKLTPEMFVRYDASSQESLRTDGQSVEAVKAGADAKVVEGVGWGAFRVGATREELIKAFGPLEPTPTPGSQWTGWVTRHHIDCWFDQAGRAVEMRFNKGFGLPLTSGVKIGSPEKDVLAAYGSPDRVVNKPQSKMLEYDKRGVLMWIVDGTVFDFTVIKPHNVSPDAMEMGHSRSKELANQQMKARERMRQDVRAFSDQERSEIESLYQVANRKWQTQEARNSLKTLVEKYKKANRTGCAILYLGQMTEGDDQIAHFKEAIADHSDSFYGDGVQVGAFARFLLGQTYLANGNADKAKALFDEIRKDYPNSVDHRGNSLVAQLPQDEGK